MKKYIVPTIMILENEVEPCMDTFSGDEGTEGGEVQSKQGGNTFNFVGSFSDDDK